MNMTLMGVGGGSAPTGPVLPTPAVVFAGQFSVASGSTSISVTTTGAAPGGSEILWAVYVNDGSYATATITDGASTTYTAETYSGQPWIAGNIRTSMLTGTVGASGIPIGQTVTFDLDFDPTLTTSASVVGICLGTGGSHDSTGKGGLVGTAPGASFTVFDNTASPPTSGGRTWLAVARSNYWNNTSVPAPWTLVGDGTGGGGFGIKLFYADLTAGQALSTTATTSPADLSYHWTSMWHAWDY